MKLMSQGWTSPLRAMVAGVFLFFAAASPALADKYASFVIDLDDNTVLHSRNADAPRYPASLTKVMTLYMVFDALKSGELMLSEQLPVSAYATRQQPSKLNLKAGSTIRVEDAIRALVTKSANDVAVVVAERLGGSESRFAALMTAKARQLGLENTRFRNASGLHNTRQISTARDMAKLGEAILVHHEEYYDYFSISEFAYKKSDYRNHNKLLGKVSGVDGIKTGYTRASGYNLLASAERDGRRVIAVMLGGSTSRTRNDHVTALLEAAFASIAAKATDKEPSLRTRIAFGQLEEDLSTNDLNAIQLRELDTPETAEAVTAQGSVEN